MRNFLIFFIFLNTFLFSEEPEGLGDKTIVSKPDQKRIDAGTNQIADLELDRPVVDTIGLLREEEKQEIEKRIYNLEREKGTQIGVLIVRSTKPESIEEYSMRVAEKWKLGRKGIDDGVLLLVAKEDRRVRIEVGYGLEGAIPDAKAKMIINDYIIPHFKQGNFYEGIEQAIDALISLIKNEELPLPADVKETKNDWFANIFMFVFGTIIFYFSYHGIRYYKKRIINILYIIINILVYIFLVIYFKIKIISDFLAFYLILAFVNLFLQKFNPHFGGRGGVSTGSWRSSSGGGFSGGGGSFGGGGASGSW